MQALERKLLVVNGKVTEIGKSLYKSITENREILDELGTVIKTLTEENEEWFKLWWGHYPVSNGFEYKNRVFKRTRPLRINEKVCKQKFLKILGEGKYTGQQLIDALTAEVMERKQESFETNKNILTYMQNSGTYLTQESFSAYINVEKKEKPVEEFEI